MDNSTNLIERLLKADAATRSELAKLVLEQDSDLLQMAKYCLNRKELRLQYMWFLTDVAVLDHRSVEMILDELYVLTKELKIPNRGASFCNYWQHCSLNDEQVGCYWSQLLDWATCPKEQITTRKRAEKVVKQLSARFPELEHEMEERLRLLDEL